MGQSIIFISLREIPINFNKGKIKELFNIFPWLKLNNWFLWETFWQDFSGKDRHFESDWLAQIISTKMKCLLRYSVYEHVKELFYSSFLELSVTLDEEKPTESLLQSIIPHFMKLPPHPPFKWSFLLHPPPPPLNECCVMKWDGCEHDCCQTNLQTAGDAVQLQPAAGQPVPPRHALPRHEHLGLQRSQGLPLWATGQKGLPGTCYGDEVFFMLSITEFH